MNCPKCSKPMRQRVSKFGPFWGCSQYPQCKGTRPIEATKIVTDEEVQASSQEMLDAAASAPPLDDLTEPAGVTNAGLIISARPTWLVLDEHQERVVGWRTGKAIVAAAAGSGKSACIIERIASLMLDGVLPETIITLVYNAAANKDMRKRLIERFGPSVAERIQAFTFHGWCYRTLKVWNPGAACLRLDRIVGSDEGPSAYKMAAQALKAAGVKGESDVFVDASGIIRESMIDLEDKNAINEILQLRVSGGCDKVARQLLDFSREYQNVKQREEATDFADMLYRVGLEILKKTTRAMKLANAYAHVQADEAQDGNVARFLIAEHLGSKAASLLMVGDARQSLYSFTGARPDLFIGQVETGATLLNLPVNRRSTAIIVEVANRICDGRKWNLGGACQAAPGAEEGEVVHLWDHTSAGTSEGSAIADEIKARIEEGVPLEDPKTNKANYALLVRTNAQAAGLEATLVTRGLPVRVLGAHGGVWSTSCGRDFLAYLQACDGMPVPDLTRVANKPLRYLKVADVKEALEQAVTGHCSVLDTLHIVGYRKLPRWQADKGRMHGCQELAASLKAIHDEYRWEDRCRAVADLLIEDVTQRAVEKVADVKTSNHSDDRQEMIESLKDTAILAGNLSAILDQIEQAKKAAHANVPAVEISTCHMAKGLQWHTVFVSGVDEGVLPHAKAEDVEEERRVFYVALTRAKKVCIISATEPSEFFTGLQYKGEA